MSWFAIIVGLLIAALILVLAGRAGFLDWLLPIVDGARNLLRDTRERVLSSQVDNALRRMWPLWLLFVACLSVVLFLNPMKAGLIIYGIGKIALAGPLGYLIDYCATARKDRPENLPDGIELGVARKCRTFVICAAILGLAVGVP